MALTIEIQRSKSGIGEASFVPLVTLSDTGSGFSYDDTDVASGQLYIYRARRRDDSQSGDCQYSDWVLAFARPPFPRLELSMCPDDIITGADTEVFVALEACQGIPTKAAWLAEYISGSINHDFMRLFGRALRNRPTMNRKVVAGRAVFEGQIVLEITPEGPFPRFMLATFPHTTATLSGPTRYEHTFSNLFGSQSLTVIQRKGETFFVYPGCKVTTAEFSFSKEQDTVLEATFTVVALDEIPFPVSLVPTAATLLGTATASTDPLPPYSPVGGTGTIGGVVAGLKQITFTVTKNLGADNVFDGNRGARSHFEKKAPVTGSASLNYQGNTNLYRDFGVTNPTGAFAAGDTIITAPVTFTFSPPANGAGFVNTLTFGFPQADVKTAQPVEGENEIPENLTFTPVDAIGESAGTDFYIKLVNSESGTLLDTPGPAIVSVPTANRVRTYLYGTVKVGSSPTTTSIPTDSTHLSSTDDAYNGRSLHFLTGAAAGETKVISDYTGATRTFTTAAFTGAPAVSDIFEIV